MNKIYYVTWKAGKFRYNIQILSSISVCLFAFHIERHISEAWVNYNRRLTKAWSSKDEYTITQILKKWYIKIFKFLKLLKNVIYKGI